MGQQASAMGTWGGALIVAGTSIGAGMLALPVVTGAAGFFPSLAVLFISWAFMTLTGLLFAELCIWLKQEVNVLGMAKKTLGKMGQAVTWVLYLFLFYCLSIAYLIGGANFFSDFIGEKLPDSAAIITVAALFIFLISRGKRVVDPINRCLMVGLFVAYVCFVCIGSSSVKPELWKIGNWTAALSALPVAFTSFGFQGTVPTLAHWMGYDRRRLRKAIVIGTSATFAIYAIWQALFLGIVPPDGPNGLQATLAAGSSAISPLHHFTNNVAVWTLSRVFAFCALTTSFLGVGVGLVHFLADGLQLRRKSSLLALAFGVPVLFALVYPHFFLQALGLAGGFGCAILLGVLPILMIWRAETDYGFMPPRDSCWIGKKWVYVGLLSFVTCEILIEVCNLL